MMGRFRCDGSYETDMQEYMDKIVKKYGIASQSAEREIMCMADAGNKVACKLYADMVFYKKILRRNPYKEAFNLYLRSAGITVENGRWSGSAASYPLSFWNIGYYLVNYRKSSFLEKCESIELIDSMSDIERLKTALELAATCITYIDAPGAVNLVGRILLEAGSDEDTFKALKPVIDRCIEEREFDRISLRSGKCGNAAECLKQADAFFTAAAVAGYVYACNNLAAREIKSIFRLEAENADDGKDEAERAVEQKKVPQYDGDDPNTAEELSGVVTYAGVSGGALMVRVNIDQYLDNGKCEMNLIQSGNVVHSSAVEIVGGPSTASCAGFDVPVAGLSGNYEIVVKLEAGGKRGTIRGEVSV